MQHTYGIERDSEHMERRRRCALLRDLTEPDRILLEWRMVDGWDNTEVAAPPRMTSRHSIRTSGRNLYIAENKPVMMTKETTKFRTCKTTSCAGRMEADNAPSAAIHALTAKE